MGDRPQACLLLQPAVASAAEPEHNSVAACLAAVLQAAGMQAEPAAGIRPETDILLAAVPVLPADIHPVRQDCQTSCQGAGECLL